MFSQGEMDVLGGYVILKQLDAWQIESPALISPALAFPGEAKSTIIEIGKMLLCVAAQPVWMLIQSQNPRGGTG